MNRVRINRNPVDAPEHCNYAAEIIAPGVGVLVVEAGGEMTITDTQNHSARVPLAVARALQIAIGEALEVRNVE